MILTMRNGGKIIIWRETNMKLRILACLATLAAWPSDSTPVLSR